MNGESEEPQPSFIAGLVYRSTPPVTGAVVSASLGALVAGFPGAVAGGVTGAVVEEVVSAYRERASTSVDNAISWASETAGMSPAELHIWAVQDSTRLNVIATTIRAALSSLDTNKIRALALVLAEAVEDDAKLDVANLITKTLMEFEPSHIRVLKAMCTEEPPPSEEPVVRGGWKHSALLRRFPQLGDGVLPIAVTLTGLAVLDEGLAGSTPDGEDDRTWVVTKYGKSVHAYLRDSANVGQSES